MLVLLIQRELNKIGKRIIFRLESYKRIRG
nr:hypothetical protein XLIUZIGB_XLIUZIGB_CDS_0004 [Caudoviricetes sp.]